MPLKLSRLEFFLTMLQNLSPSQTPILILLLRK